MNVRFLFAIVMMFALFSADASAQRRGFNPSPPSSPSAAYPARLTQRPITIPRMHIRGDLALRINRLQSGGRMGGHHTDLRLDLGAAIGITDQLEVGVSGQRQGLTDLGGLLPLHVSPKVDFGDIYVYGRFAFLQGTFEMGGELGIEIPVRSHFTMHFALPMRLHLGEMFSLDGGAEFVMAFKKDDFEAVAILTVQPRLAPVDFLFFGLDTGVAITMTNDPISTSIPLGFEGGYVLDLEPARIDFFANMSFPSFLSNGEVVTKRLQVTIGARGYFNIGG